MDRIARLFLPPLLLLFAFLASTAIAHEGNRHDKIANHPSEVAQLRGDVERVDVIVFVADERAPFCKVVLIDDPNSMRGGSVDAFDDRDGFADHAVSMTYMDRSLYLLDDGNVKKAVPMCTGTDSTVSAYNLDMIDRGDDAPTARLRC